MEVEFIEKFIKDEFPRITLEERKDLVNSVWLFFAENNIFQDSDLSDDVLKKLKKQLSSELKQINWREVGIEDWGGRISKGFTDANISEDEKLSFFKAKSEQTDRIEIRDELEKALAVFESRKEELKLLLPPVLFEALQRSIFADAPVKVTAGFEEQILKILCWRALMRIKWIRQ